MISIALSTLAAMAVFFIFEKVKKQGYEQGYEDGLNDRRPKYKISIGYNPQQHDKR